MWWTFNLDAWDVLVYTKPVHGQCRDHWQYSTTLFHKPFVVQPSEYTIQFVNNRWSSLWVLTRDNLMRWGQGWRWIGNGSWSDRGYKVIEPKFWMSPWRLSGRALTLNVFEPQVNAANANTRLRSPHASQEAGISRTRTNGSEVNTTSRLRYAESSATKSLFRKWNWLWLSISIFTWLLFLASYRKGNGYILNTVTTIVSTKFTEEPNTTMPTDLSTSISAIKDSMRMSEDQQNRPYCYR